MSKRPLHVIIFVFEISTKNPTILQEFKKKRKRCYI